MVAPAGPLPLPLPLVLLLELEGLRPVRVGLEVALEAVRAAAILTVEDRREQGELLSTFPSKEPPTAVTQFAGE